MISQTLKTWIKEQALYQRLEAQETDLNSDPKEFSLDDLLIQQSSSDKEVSKKFKSKTLAPLQDKKQDDEVPLVAPLVQENFPAFTSEISPEVNNVIESEKHRTQSFRRSYYSK